MIAWGGRSSSAPSNTGGRYDPVADVWEGLTTIGAPAPRDDAAAVWTGTSMLVWGGQIDPSQGSYGGLYDPVADAWQPVSDSGAPAQRLGPAMVWTGTRLLVWGGWVPLAGKPFGDGALYAPSTDSWTPITSVGAPSARGGSSVVWTGRQVLLWGGRNSQDYPGDGGRFDPGANAWHPVATAGAPPATSGHAACWTGDAMIVWGGSNGVSVSRGGALKLPGTEDVDADGFSVCDGDCDDGAPSVWSTPGEVAGVSFASRDALSWSAPAEPGGSAPRYDAIRSATPVDFVATATCVATDASGTSALDPDAPAPGEGLYYLVRAENACPGIGVGPLGSSSDGTPRTGRTCP